MVLLYIRMFPQLDIMKGGWLNADLLVCCRRIVIRVWLLNGCARVWLNGSHPERPVDASKL